MKNYKIAWVVCLAYCLFGIFFPLLVSVLGVRNRLDNSQPSQDIFIELPDRGSLEQTFIAKHDFINIVVLNLKNPGLGNKGEFKFILQSKDGSPLVERPFSGYNIEDPSSLRFQFDPIPSSKNKEFKIMIKSLSSEKPAVSVSAGKNNGINYYVYYKTLNKKTALLEFIGNLMKRFWADKFFSVFWLLVIILIARLALKSFKKK